MSTINEQLNALIPQDFADASKVWVYQSSRPFSEQQALEIKEQLKHFYLQWEVHGKDLKGWANLLFNRFIVFMAEEDEIQVSGCSIDTTHRLLKSLERQYETTLFDRLSITFLVNSKPEALPMNQVQYALDNNHIDENTLLFNNTVTTKKELLTDWLQPLSQSWLAGRLKFNTPSN